MNVCYDKLNKDSFEVIEKNSDASINDFSDNVEWYEEIEAQKDNRCFNIYIEGNTISEISYGSWVSSYNYTIKDF